MGGEVLSEGREEYGYFGDFCGGGGGYWGRGEVVGGGVGEGGELGVC